MFITDATNLLDRITSTRRVQTEAMKKGIQLEPRAAEEYAKLLGGQINLMAVGIIISQTSPWLAASPDRRVYNPNRTHPYGLLEIKCPNTSSVCEASYLKVDDDAKIYLKMNDNIYFEILMQLAVTGLRWCDMFVWCKADGSHHLQTIHFDEQKWQEVKDKVDAFHFDKCLPYYVKQENAAGCCCTFPHL